jgi:hypothetical protein
VAIVLAPLFRSVLGYERVLEADVEQYADSAWMRRCRQPQPGGRSPNTARVGRVACCRPNPFIRARSRPVGQLGANAHGEVLEFGQVRDCYLGPRLTGLTTPRRPVC